MLRDNEIVYRSGLLDLGKEFPDLLSPELELDPARASALAQSLRRIRGDTRTEDDEPESLDFGSAIG